ncbi:MAG: tetratricopeptide repeat protein [Candidatus Rokubacteria bacterium]|nr:tetratricopeptide repeat protein [Candidatus Rokubacteria bacterium]
MQDLTLLMVLVAVVVALAGGCARSPEARKARHLERGERYAKAEKYRDAIIEFRNVLRIDSANAQAIRQLGLAHFQLGEMGQAFRFLLRAQELEPDQLEVRLKLASIYLLGGKPDEARAQAEIVLERQPKNLEALVLAAGAASTPEGVEAAIRRLEAARADFGGQARLYLALAALHLKKRDVPAAERAFQEAVAREPKSVEAHLALANFLVGKRDASGAEREFKTAAELAPAGSPARVRLADFYLLLGRPEEAKKTLDEMTGKAPDFLPAWRRRAEIAFAEKKWDDAVKALDVVLKKSPSDIDGHLLRGRVHLAKRETTEAIQEFQKVLKAEPRLAPVRHQLALAHLQAGSPQQAKTELKEAVTLAPNFADAVLLLAELNIQAGAVQPAIEDLERLLARQPQLVQAHVLLGAAYLAKREPARAVEVYRKFAALLPKHPRGPYLIGMALLVQGKRAEAKKQFEASLALGPGFIEPLAQLVTFALAEKRPDAALDLVKNQIAAVPRSGWHQDLRGTVHLARGETALAETAYLKAIELEPRLLGPYVRVGSLYASSGKYEEALAKFGQALKVNPGEVRALMLTGVIHEHRGDFARAREAYEKAIAAAPRFAPAANNLAWIYSEHGGDQEKALQLAQMAKEVSPEDPRISDTLGWILHKRGIHQRALALLRDSASKLPDSPMIQYHLGMAALKAGDKEAAQRALTIAAKSPADFPGKGEARQALAAIK